MCVYSQLRDIPLEVRLVDHDVARRQLEQLAVNHDERAAANKRLRSNRSVN